jgi:ubiquinol-cytochrome c reductase cytochrome c1 subunit
VRRLFFALLLAPLAVFASGDELKLDHANIDPHDAISIQRGARTFVNYCLNCHSANSMRYNRMTDLGLTEQQIKENLLFASEKVGDPMAISAGRKDQKLWFGAEPPDLSVVARSRGTDWLYTYLRTFYRDEKRPTGWNNLAFPNVGMPHALWQLQGEREPQFEEREIHGHPTKVFTGWKQVTPGELSSVQYDEAVSDLVSYLTWMSEPAQNSRVRVGVWVLLFLGVFTFFAWRLNAAYWKNI